MKSKIKIIVRVALWIFTLTLVALTVLFSICLYAYAKIDLDGDITLFSRSRSFESTTFYANKNGTALRLDEDYEPVELEISGALKKIHYPLEEISPYLKRGIVAVEDVRFYEHRGVDVKRTLAAALNCITKSSARFGGSTITQQVVKNISGDKEVKLSRKLNEIIRAIHIEQNYTKDDILELYLNVIPMSDNIYGVGLASRSLFGCEPNELSPAQAATLIGITNAPSAYSPYTNPEKCMEKRNIVLSVMLREGVITKEEYDAAYSEDLSVLPREESDHTYDSWFVETVISHATEDLAKKMNLSRAAAEHLLLGGGYKIYTTMDISAQKKLEEYFENEENFPNEINEGLGYAMVVCENSTGNLAAIVGGVGKKRENRILNRATVPHTPGSTLKPIALYAPLLDEGKITWSTVLDDTPTAFYEEDGGYRAYPKNSPNIYDGLITVKDAVRLSKNTIAVRLAELRGVKSIFYDLKNGYGFDTLVESEKNKDGQTLTDMAISPMALGQLSYGVPLTKLTEAYSVLASEGVHKKMRSYLAVYDYEDKLVLENLPITKKMLEPTTARIMTQLLCGVVSDGTAKAITLDEITPVAGKTGTSGGGRDKLFVGYTPSYTAAIWCGYDAKNKSCDGITPSHLKIWDEVMTDIHGDKVGQSFSTEGLVYRPYCKDSGALYSENCLYDVRGSRLEYGYFTADTAPNSVCEAHITCYYDSVEKGIATPYCPEEDLVKISLIRVDRAFPCEVYITDAEYVYRDTDEIAPTPDTDTLPYFYYALPPDEYAGISGDKKQFNSICKIHK